MAGNISIAKRCKELKIELREGNEETLVDVLLRWIGRGKPASPLIGTIAFFLLSILIGLILAVLLGELDKWQRLIQNLSTSPSLFAWVVFGLFASSASMVVANIYFHNIVAVIRDHLLDTIEVQENFNAMKNWVDLLCNKRFAFLTAVIGGVLVSPIVISINNDAAGVFVGIGYTVLLFLFSAQSTLFFGFIYGILMFALRMNRLELRLFEADPATSEIIARLSGSLNGFVYFVAAYGALQTFGIVTLKLPFFTTVLFLFWAAIVAIFVTSQYSLAQIIQRAKWKTLNVTQQKIAKIQKDNSPLSKEHEESLLWLLNYHDRVKVTRNSAFDWNAGFSFLNSMLLPLLGFVLGNMDNIFSFFR